MTTKALLKYCTKEVDTLEWENWQPLHQPTIERGKGVSGYNFPGVYHIRNHSTKQNIIVGVGELLVTRMRSWYTQDYASGTRRNSEKREFLHQNWQNLEYRVLKTNDIWEAKFVEGVLLGSKSFKFNT